MFADKLCSLSDEDLLEQYCSTRNQKAVREIYQRYKDPLFRYCAQTCLRHCVPVMEKLWGMLLDNPPSPRERQLKNWFYIQINKLMQLPQETSSETSSEPHAAEESLREALERSDILQAIQQLPRRQRNIFLLVNECGLSLATAADIERITLAQGRQDLAEARNLIAFNLHGSARKPWKSADTLAKEAAESAEREVTAPKTETIRPAVPWSSWGKRPAKHSPATPATADRSVEVAQV
ncbi:sigma factor-like helix-turn-helix DNA-binding protein [Microbulbifer bruguierae]|uniref:Sigma factor-like helix-turn-helix DNA-binding protein n=1 Tax=Microbulbifer bruguierae TaxID=3029061 RepID=A0ABY8NGB3_9GAMM|nr:sigma factor-like helix-turn-helix DNA-binding protein [Microbulbifer bruguierae]WGL16548.1 sigma factor-like helix-turn-helix DNA-binding protein [Microbulbifer bruguierae]